MYVPKYFLAGSNHIGIGTACLEDSRIVSQIPDSWCGEMLNGNYGNGRIARVALFHGDVD